MPTGLTAPRRFFYALTDAGPHTLTNHRNEATNNMPRNNTLTDFRRMLADNPRVVYATGVGNPRFNDAATRTQRFWDGVRVLPQLAPEPENAVDPAEQARQRVQREGNSSLNRILDHLLEMCHPDTPGQVDPFYIRQLARLEDARYGLNDTILLLVNEALPAPPGRGRREIEIWPMATGAILVPIRNSNAHDYRLGVPVRVQNHGGQSQNVAAISADGHRGNSLPITDTRPPTTDELERFIQAEIQGVPYNAAQ